MISLQALRRLRIASKLNMAIGVSIVLVATMIINEQITNRLVVRLNGAADQQQEIAIEIAKIEATLRRAQVAGRDLRMGRTAVAVEKNIAALNQIAAETNRRLEAVKELSRSPDDLARFNLARKQLDTYVAALGELALTQTRILTLFAKRSEIDTKWLRSVNIVVNSTAFSMAPNGSELEYLISTATLAFKDTYAASWRYFVLNEESQARQIATSSETAVKHLRLLRESTKNTAAVSGVDGLLAIVTEFTIILDETTRSIAAQNDIQERANQAEGEILRFLDEAIRASTALADIAKSAAADGADRAALVRNIVGITIVVVLLGLAVFISRSIGRPIRRIGESCWNSLEVTKLFQFPTLNVATRLVTTHALRTHSGTIFSVCSTLRWNATKLKSGLPPSANSSCTSSLMSLKRLSAQSLRQYHSRRFDLSKQQAL